VQDNTVKPTEKAFALIDSLGKYAVMITKPEMTKTLELEMDEIREGKRMKKDVVNDSRDMLRVVFKEMTQNREEIVKSLKEAIRVDTILGTCPECGSELFLANSPRGKRFVGCLNYPTCNFSLPLPKSGRVLVTTDTCDKHPFLFKLRILKRGMKRAWDFGCPYCNFLQWGEKNGDTDTKL